MSITNPFFQNNNLNNNNPEQKSQKLPPKINNQNLPPSKDQILNKKNQQYQSPPHIPNNSIKKTENNYYNDSLTKENNSKINSEYDTKIKPYNCSSNFISTISSVFPQNYKTLSQLEIPMSISINPMSAPSIEIPFINYGENNIPRCLNKPCQAYMNPFVKFFENGDKWICNICGNINKTEEIYYSNLDQNGIRLDINEKPELHTGSYEFYANKSYWKKNKDPTEALFIFIFETSTWAVDSGFFPACLEGVKDVINNESFYNGNKVKISFITYNSGIDFYSFNNKSTQPQMLTINEDPVFLPTDLNNLIFTLDKDKDKILQIMDSLQSTFNSNNQNMPNSHCKDSVLILEAVKAGYLLGRKLGGKIIVFSSSNMINSIPKMVEGIENGMTKEQIAYSPHDKKKLGNMGINLTNEFISVDIFASADTQISTYTLNQLCQYSNGHLYFYKKFKIDLHYKNIFNQIHRVLTRPICWEGVNKTRYSSGYKISGFSTPLLIASNEHFIFPVGDSDQNYLFNISPPEEKPKEESDKKESNINYMNDYGLEDKDKYLYIQSALLYSYGDGTRRIRVHNLCLPLSNDINDIYNGINSEMVATYYLKETINKIYKTKNIANSIISTDTQFKHFVDKVMASQNKISKELPPNLDYLPLYMLGMFKHRIFYKEEIEKNYDIDISNYIRIFLQKLSSQEIMQFLVPSIYSLHDIYTDKNIGTYNSETGDFIMPNLISSIKSSMENNGLYLIDNGYMLIIYIRKNLDSNIFQSLFGVESFNFLTQIINENSVFDENESNEFKDRIKNILDYIRGMKSIFQNLVFVFEEEGGERIINEALIEDNLCKWFPMDYSTFYKKYINGKNTFGY